jgi:hypothetical protein
VSRPTLGPTQPPVQRVPGILSPGLRRGRGVTLTTHPHLVPRSRMSMSYTSSPPSAFVACSRTALALINLLITANNRTLRNMVDLMSCRNPYPDIAMLRSTLPFRILGALSTSLGKETIKSYCIPCFSADSQGNYGDKIKNYHNSFLPCYLGYNSSFIVVLPLHNVVLQAISSSFCRLLKLEKCVIH